MAAALKKSLARNGAGSSGGDGYPSYCPCDARTARGDQLSPVECRVARPSGPTASSNRVEEIALTGRVGVGAGVNEGVNEAGSVTTSRRGSNWKFIGCPMRADWRVSSRGMAWSDGPVGGGALAGGWPLSL